MEWFTPEWFEMEFIDLNGNNWGIRWIIKRASNKAGSAFAISWHVIAATDRPASVRVVDSAKTNLAGSYFVLKPDNERGLVVALFQLLIADEKGEELAKTAALSEQTERCY